MENIYAEMGVDKGIVVAGALKMHWDVGKSFFVGASYELYLSVSRCVFGRHLPVECLGVFTGMPPYVFPSVVLNYKFYSPLLHIISVFIGVFPGVFPGVFLGVFPWYIFIVDFLAVFLVYFPMFFPGVFLLTFRDFSP